MSTLEDYANKYQSVRFERRDGILQMTLHTDGASLRWGFGPHGEGFLRLSAFGHPENIKAAVESIKSNLRS